jgi:hypothetical protein
MMIRFHTKHLLASTAMVAVLLWIALAVGAMLRPRFVVCVDHPNGTRLRVIQQFEYSGDLFNTSIYFDTGDGQWRWYYFDHDDSYWGRADSEVVGNEIRIAANRRRILFDTLTGECRISNEEVGNRTYRKSSRIVGLPRGMSAVPKQTP